ncbi:hypothetical protein ACFLXY_06580 [Chloroflexota bacterium]
MKRRLYYPLAVVILAIVLGIVGWFSESSSIRWIAPAFGLALIAVGLGINSIIIAFQTEKRATELVAALARIERLAEEMREELGSKKNPSAQIIPTLEAFSKYYLDYLNKPEGEDKK